MNVGDTFTYRGPAWDLSAGGPEKFIAGERHVVVVEAYQDFYVVAEVRWPDERYVIQTKLGTITDHTPKDSGLDDAGKTG